MNASSLLNIAVKEYLETLFAQEPPVLEKIRTESHHEGLPAIQIPTHLGKLLYLITKIHAPKKILEIGTLGGYSTAWLLAALTPEGHLISLEINPEYAQKARKHLQAFAEKSFEIRVGHAVELVAQLAEQNEGPFDLILIDADKENYALYLDWAIRLSQPGSLILIDNLIPKGNQVGTPSHDQAKEVYAFNDYLTHHPQLELAALPTLVGPEGRLDAFALARVKS